MWILSNLCKKTKNKKLNNWLKKKKWIYTFVRKKKFKISTISHGTNKITNFKEGSGRNFIRWLQQKSRISSSDKKKRKIANLSDCHRENKIVMFNLSWNLLIFCLIWLRNYSLNYFLSEKNFINDFLPSFSLMIWNLYISEICKALGPDCSDFLKVFCI